MWCLCLPAGMPRCANGRPIKRSSGNDARSHPPKGHSGQPRDLANRDDRNLLRCTAHRSEEHTSELQSLMRISYAVFCLKKKTTHYEQTNTKTGKLTT